MDRTRFIGASEVSTIMGQNPFSTPYQLWALKTGAIDPIEENEPIEWGHRLERVVSEKFADKHGVKLIARKTRYVHPAMSYFSCELDNIIAKTDELVEIKTVNAYAWKEWSNPEELPSYVIIQVNTQMGLSGRKKAWVACLCGGQKYIEKELAFDQELFKITEDAVKNFWENFVIPRIAPMAVSGDDELIVKLNPNKSDTERELSSDWDIALARYLELAGQIKPLEEERKDLKAKIMQVIDKNTGVRTERYFAKRIDIPAKEYVVKSAPTWYFRVFNNKEVK